MFLSIRVGCFMIILSFEIKTIDWRIQIVFYSSEIMLIVFLIYIMLMSMRDDKSNENKEVNQFVNVRNSIIKLRDDKYANI